jgi:hypothetical protein
VASSTTAQFKSQVYGLTDDGGRMLILWHTDV